MVVLASLVAILGVIAGVIALLRGGRFERLVGLFYILRRAITHAVGLAWWPHHVPATAYGNLARSLPEVVLLAALLWLIRRKRLRWVMIVLVVQTAYVGACLWRAYDPSTQPLVVPALLALGFLRAGILLAATVRHNLAPPAPAPGERDFDRTLAMARAARVKDAAA